MSEQHLVIEKADGGQGASVGVGGEVSEARESFEDWNDYCHYVAGLVGIGLSELFLASNLENSEKLRHFIRTHTRKKGDKGTNKGIGKG